jgi:hypothetical protein
MALGSTQPVTEMSTRKINLPYLTIFQSVTQPSTEYAMESNQTAREADHLSLPSVGNMNEWSFASIVPIRLQTMSSYAEELCSQ